MRFRPSGSAVTTTTPSRSSSRRRPEPCQELHVQGALHGLPTARARCRGLTAGGRRQGVRSLRGKRFSRSQQQGTLNVIDRHHDFCAGHPLQSYRVTRVDQALDELQQDVRRLRGRSRRRNRGVQTGEIPHRKRTRGPWPGRPRRRCRATDAVSDAATTVCGDNARVREVASARAARRRARRGRPAEDFALLAGGRDVA